MYFFHTTTNSLSTVLENNAFSQGKKQSFSYSAFGDTQRTQGGGSPGFNSERHDPLTGVQHLGNGYRAYNPVLMRFNAPDSQSPFGAGGINSYAYCAGDPVNNVDPSGHSHNKAIGGIFAGVLAIVLGVASGGIAIAASGSVLALVSATGVSAAVAIAGGSYAIYSGKTASDQDKEAQKNAPYELLGPEEDFGRSSLRIGISAVLIGMGSVASSIHGRKARIANKEAKADKNRLPKGERMQNERVEIEAGQPNRVSIGSDSVLSEGNRELFTGDSPHSSAAASPAVSNVPSPAASNVPSPAVSNVPSPVASNVPSAASSPEPLRRILVMPPPSPPPVVKPITSSYAIPENQTWLQK